MAHPTCAPARHPNVRPAGENSLHKPEVDRAALAKQVEAELSALREAYRAGACVRKLLFQVQGSPSGECDISRTEAEALVALVNAEFERRAQIAKATIALMPVAGTADGNAI